MQRGKSLDWLIRGLMIVGVAGLLLAGYSWFRITDASPAEFHGTAYPDAPPAPDFTLIDERGEASSLSDHRGRTVLIFFGFTRCPDVCPLTLARLANVIRANDLTPDRIRVLLVSVDPEYDTPERLREYIAPHGPSFTGLTASVEEIEAVMADYGAYAAAEHSHDGAAPDIAHTGLVFGIDTAGRLRALLHPEESIETLEADVRTLLALEN